MSSRKLARDSFRGLRVHQWAEEWHDVQWDEALHRREPPEYFYVASIEASKLRRLSGIFRRDVSAGTERSADLAIQRIHDPERSAEIASYRHFGYPWSDLTASKRDSGQFDDLRKPGWLPTAIVVNVIPAGESRGGLKLRPQDAVTIEESDGIATFQLPVGYRSADWKPPVRPVEVIDGQHRLWAFEDDPDIQGFELPVVAFVGLDISWQAYLFWTINIKPKKISPSLAFDLYPLLRTEDWLERFAGHSVYREARAQELVEALWSHSDSPWFHRIDMLGERTSSSGVTQAAWVRSLMSTFVKSWESTRTPIGGLFGTAVGSDKTVLPWDRAQQAAFLIFIWRTMLDAVSHTRAPWTAELEPSLLSTEARFYGRHVLLSTDQGVRGILAVANDLCYVAADELRLRAWSGETRRKATDQDAVSVALRSLEDQPVAEFWASAARELAKFDWRSSSDPNLTDPERLEKAVYRGGTGYRILRMQLIDLLVTARGPVARAAASVKSATAT